MSDLQAATFAGGCFWCVEAAFKELEGVESVTSGYCGGHVENPTYEQVVSGKTGHAEAVLVEYDPDIIAYEDLLRVFFTIHDPTTKDREGPDVGPQYRSAVFYHDEDQRETVEAFFEELEREGAFDDPIVTKIEPLDAFWEAEEYHQDYYEKVSTADGNTNDAYCQVNVVPKIEKVREKFADKVKAEPESDI